MSDVKLEAINQITPVAKRLEGQTIILTGGGNGIDRMGFRRFHDSVCFSRTLAHEQEAICIICELRRASRGC